MVITTENIVHYLTDKNLVSAESVVDGDFLVVDMTRRNRNFKIIRKKEKGFFVKQVKNFDQESIRSLHREAQSYYLAKHDQSFSGIAELMPGMVQHDAAKNILILELYPESENLSELHSRTGSFPEPIATSLGKSLGKYHKDISLTIEEVKAKNIFPAALPWMLTMNNQYIQQIKNSNPGYFQFFSIIDKYPEFLSAIEELRNGWRVNSLIHGDMKWDNCLLFKENDEPRLKIIDWELADLGDSSWDVGAVFQTYLSLWVMSIPTNNQDGNNESGHAAKYKIDDMQPAIKAFWRSYTNTMEMSKDIQEKLIEKCTNYAAVRMIQTVYEQVHFTKQLSKNAIYLLQLSLNILKNPSDAVEELLGL